jgi:hypothetical protein
MPKTIEIRPFADGNIVNHWWQWALIGVVAASGLVGLITTVVWLVKSIREKFRVRELIPS